jgi:predicted SAM-dependent methyltransferase
MNWYSSAKQLLRTVLDRIRHRRQYTPSIEQKALDEHLNLIHQGRIALVSQLPQGDIILDLGGANCPLFKMGYPHRFKKLYLIDLPPDERCDMYKEIVIDKKSDNGEVLIKYGNMIDLGGFPDESVDFVWSGQSIEHVSPENGIKMCQAVFRVLKNGGAFCLDTPNRKVTEIHTKDIGGGFIHPEHCIEYTPQQLRKMLEKEGFHIVESLGVCEMPETVATGKFHYEDFMAGEKISKNIDSSYIQYFHCVKP